MITSEKAIDTFVKKVHVAAIPTLLYVKKVIIVMHITYKLDMIMRYDFLLDPFMAILSEKNPKMILQDHGIASVASSVYNRPGSILNSVLKRS